ncbi:MAG: hypothetical protein WBL05_11450 [Brooklawnia sp.]|uniref:hypothetical protein n=1 Tax=Brooklawnia sp. TaxID=2699740 RepID=UPI003C762377
MTHPELAEPGRGGRLRRGWHWTIGAVLALHDRPLRRDERGLSQSTENAVLLIGAITIAAIVIAAVTNYVQSRLQGLA